MIDLQQISRCWSERFEEQVRKLVNEGRVINDSRGNF